MKQLKCPNCGAPINRATMRCEYCGAVFKEDLDRQIFMIENPKIVTLGAEVVLDNQLAMYDGCEQFAMNRLTEKLAEGISKFMDVTIQEHPRINSTVISGRVRIVPPKTML